MPDLLSHILIVLIVCELTNFKRKGLLILGAILPDLITKFLLLGYIVNIPGEVVDALALFHGLVPVFFLVFLVSVFFKDFSSAVYLIGVGALSHLLLDVLTIHFSGGMRFFFPFSWIMFRINIYWPDEYLLTLIPLLVMYVVIKLFKPYFYESFFKNKN